MDKLTSIRIKYDNQNFSDDIPISPLAENVRWDENYSIKDIAGAVNIEATGSLQQQINEKVSSVKLNEYVENEIKQDVSDWLNKNVDVNKTVITDKTLSIDGAAADAKIVGDFFKTQNKIDESVGKITWQIPQGVVSNNPMVTISNNRIIINGTINTLLRIVVYGSELKSCYNAPTYKNHSDYYLEPIESFTPGHSIEAYINLIDGTYSSLKTPYLDLRTIETNTEYLYQGNKKRVVLEDKPQMIIFGVHVGVYNNAIFEFSILDMTILENNAIVYTALENIKKQINYLEEKNKNEEDIIFYLDGTRYVQYNSSVLKGLLNVGLYNNLFFVNGNMQGLQNNNASISFLISPSLNYYGEIPSYETSKINLKNFARGFDGIPLEGFKQRHKYLINLKLISGTYSLQSSNTLGNNIQLYNSSADLIFQFSDNIDNQNNADFSEQWICNDLPDCMLLSLKVGNYNNAVFKITIKDLTLISNNISLNIEKNGLINISSVGMWLQGTYATDTGYVSNDNYNNRIHWAGSLPKKTRYIQFEDPYQVAFYGWGFEQNDEYQLIYTPKGWLLSWETNTNLFWHKNENGTYFIDLNEVKDYFPDVKYISMSVKLKDNTNFNQSYGPNVKVYVEPDAVPFTNNYTLTEEDFSIGYFSPTNKNNIYQNNTAKKYLTTAKFQVHPGDKIKGVLDPSRNDLGFLVLFLESDLQENNTCYRSNSSFKYLENFQCYAYEDGYCEISIASDNNLNPTLLGDNKITIYRNCINKYDKLNLITQSRYFYGKNEKDANENFIHLQPLTLIHFSDNHGSVITLDKIQELLESQDYVKNVTTGSNYRKMFTIDDILNTGDAVYTYYGYAVDGVAVTDFYDESSSYIIGDYIVYDSKLYQCTTNTSGAFNNNHWNLISNTLQSQRLLTRKSYLDHQIGKKALFVLGNHDTQIGDYNTTTGTTNTTNQWHALEKTTAYNTYFAQNKDSWGIIDPNNINYPNEINWQHVNYPCYWHKDYPLSKIRLIGIDMAYWDASEFTWLEFLLSDARANEYSVILASHSQLSKATGNPNITFQDLATDIHSPGKYRNSGNWSYGTYPDFWHNESQTVNNEAANIEIMTLLQDYHDVIICHLHGHWHIDMFEYYDLAPDILTIGIDQGGADRAVHSAERTKTLPNWHVFNVITFDPQNKLLKIVRFGNDIDHLLRSKKVLTYDYENKIVITNY